MLGSAPVSCVPGTSPEKSQVEKAVLFCVVVLIQGVLVDWRSPPIPTVDPDEPGRSSGALRVSTSATMTSVLGAAVTAFVVSLGDVW